MTFPKTVDEMIAQGYKQVSADATCRDIACRETIEWWKTKNGKFVPINPGTAKPHWATCVAAKKFRK